MTDDKTPDSRNLEDQWIAVRCQLGERAAFDELIQRWHGPLWKYLRRLTGEDEMARELAQEVWIRVLRNIARLQDGSKLRAWLFGIAHRTWIDRLRQRYAAPASIDVDLHELPDGEPTDTLELELSTMEQELARLPDIEREILTLFYLRELSLNEVAEALDIPTGTVKSRLHRARLLLRRELENKGAFT